MSGHVFVVGADLTRLSCDDVLVPTDRSLRVAGSWLPLLPGDAVAGRDGDAVRLAARWAGDERVLELPGGGERRIWLVDTLDPGGPDRDDRDDDDDDDGDGAPGRGLAWLLDGAREGLAAVAGRAVDRPAHGRSRRLVGLPALRGRGAASWRSSSAPG